MTLAEFLDILRAKVRAQVEKNVDKILDSLKNDQDKVEAFQLDRLHLDELIARLEREQFEDIQKRLDELSDQLEQGVKAMSDSLAKIKNFARGAELFAKVVGLVARVVALA
jgi:predicted nuclease with TOPRIM domain